MHDYGWFQVVPVAKLGLGFLEATELVSTHPPASRFQIFIVVSSTSLGKYAFKNVHLVKKKKIPLTVILMEVLEREQN